MVERETSQREYPVAVAWPFDWKIAYLHKEGDRLQRLFDDYRTQVANIKEGLERGTFIVKKHRKEEVRQERKLPLSNRQRERLEANRDVLAFKVANGPKKALPHDLHRRLLH